MYFALKQKVWEANLSLPDYGLVTFTWGNVSEIDRERGVFAIKPSGISYESMTPEDMVVLDLSGNILDGDLNPSSDTPTHLELYRAFPQIGGIVHTHSKFATIWAQAGTDIPVLGTTHADYFYGDIPCTRALNDVEIMTEYEKNTGKVIVETFLRKNIEPLAIPAAIISEHGPFCWGKSGKDAVHNAVVLEEISMMALNTITINPRAKINHVLLDKHYHRKHGVNAYYGQNRGLV